MRPLAIALFLAAAVGSGTAARAAELPDGLYRCEMYSGTMLMHLGDIEIEGSSYRGPGSDGNYDGTHPLEVTDAGTIDWGGPMGGFSSGGNTIVSTVLTGDSARPGFDISIQLKSGNFSTVSCSPQ